MTTTLLNNRYQIVQVLGAGGFSETFLAEDTYMPSRRRCVIKQIKPLTDNPQMYQLYQQRFGREAAILESLGEGSDQIPKLYAYFSENGQFYLVQEWIQGKTLTEVVEAEGPLSETAVRNILVSLLPVLDYVHSQGIIHRDIKPDNIILRSSNGKPVLIDFGAVKETMAIVVNSQGKTNSSIVVGTPGFMSPEQAVGRPIYATDLYSLGVTAIYLLTGKLPQDFETDSQTHEMLWQRHALNVSPSLAAVLNTAIQYHPRDRYTTAIKMLDALQTSASIPPRQPSTQATVVLSPPGGKASSQPGQVSPQTAPVINHPSSQGNQNKTVILGSLLAGGLLAAAVVVGLVRQPPESSISERAGSREQGAGSREQGAGNQSTPAAESPAPVSEPADAPPEPVPSQTPSPPVTSTPSPEEEETAEAPSPPVTSAPPPKEEEQTTEAPSPPVTSTPPPEEEEETAEVPSPPVTSAPPPEEEETAEAPSPPVTSAPPPEEEEQNDPAGNAPRQSIPGFPTGTSESTVKAELGNPTETSRGRWGNTRAVIYDVEPDRITLGYLFDRTSGRLRQTEVSFAQSVEPEMMQATLQQMLGDRAFININQGLQQVYQRRANKYSFNTSGLKGVIERNDRDRIYIGVWEADLH